MDRLYIETKIMADEAGSLSGIAWDFARPDRVGDVIEPDAVKGTAFPLPLLFAHDLSDPIGTVDSAEVKGDKLTWKGKALVHDVPRAAQVMALTKAGSVRGFSMGFRIIKAVDRRESGRVVGRLIKKLEWLEGSLVSLPMHPGARVVSAKSAVSALNIAAAINRAAAHIAAAR